MTESNECPSIKRNILKAKIIFEAKFLILSLGMFYYAFFTKFCGVSNKANGMWSATTTPTDLLFNPMLKGVGIGICIGIGVRYIFKVFYGGFGEL